MLYSDGVDRDSEPELNRVLRELSTRRLDTLILSLHVDRLALLAALERKRKAVKTLSHTTGTL